MSELSKEGKKYHNHDNVLPFVEALIFRDHGIADGIAEKPIWNGIPDFRQDFRISPPSIIVLKMSIIVLKMYRYSYTLIQTNYNIISHHDNTKYYYFFILTITLKHIIRTAHHTRNK